MTEADLYGGAALLLCVVVGVGAGALHYRRKIRKGL